jgi:hypothetical protein
MVVGIPPLKKKSPKASLLTGYQWENLGEEWLYPILMIDNQTIISKILVNLLKII